MVYGLDGSLAAQGADSSGNGSLSINVGRLSAGIYLCRLEKRMGSSIQVSTTLKLAIVK
jgi:hypothetical protein